MFPFARMPQGKSLGRVVGPPPKAFSFKTFFGFEAAAR